ncbi:MAG: ATP-dependent Clp protease adaptor protein ClpS [Cyclobacteriaceae bacterium]|jgi:ATP-dependent Clp protease adaptor protein ClpS
MAFEYQEEELVEVLEDQDTEEGKVLVVFNDDFNTFEHVISTLVKVCKHEKNQAEQCTLLIHFKGKCKVKEGSFTFLKPMREGITDAGINAAIV